MFESGNPGSGELKGHFETGGYPPPVFKHKTNRIIDGIFYPAFTPLQAVDFLAYEIFLTKKILAKKKALAISRPMQEFQYMPEQIRIFKGDRLASIEDNFTQPKKVRGLWRVV